MGASQSFLSSPQYGYDYVVAVTQDSINATAKHFLHTKQPVVNVCYIYDENDKPKEIDYEALKKMAKGADPFNVPASGSERVTALQNLDDAGFMYGWRAAMGLPEGFKPDKLPDIVTLGATADAPVTYRLLCKNFLLVTLREVHRKLDFTTFAQPKGPDGEPWIFIYKVPIKPDSIKDNKAFIESAAFGNLPATVQTNLKKNPEDFTIQHLLFDFNKMSDPVVPDMPKDIDPDLKGMLIAHFAIKYFAEMEATKSPIVAVTPSSNDPFAGLQTEFSVTPVPAQPKLSTLNYLCATAGHALPPAKPFTWNWVESNEADDIDGVCVINRSDLVQYLKSHLEGYVQQNCWLIHPIAEKIYFSEEIVGFLLVDMNYNSWGKQGRPESLKSDFTYAAPTVGPTLLQWQFTASREDDESYFKGWGGDSWLKVNTSFDLKVICAGKTLTIAQHVVVHYDLVIETSAEHTTLVDIAITDTFTLAAAGDKLTANLTPKKVDSSQEPAHWKLAPQLQSQMNDTKKKAMNQISSRLVDIPLSLLNGVIFPGGKGFLFKDVWFSDHQDMVAHITYADPD